MDLLFAIFLGLITGLISGLLGVGGGFIVVPSLIFLGFDPHVAVATSLLSIVFLTSSGSMAHWRLKHVRKEAILPIIIPAVLTAQIGAYLSLKTPSSLLKTIFGLVLLLVSLRYIVAKDGGDSQGRGRGHLLIIGIISGVLSAFLGIGGGIVLVPLLTIYGGFSIKEGIGTSSMVVVFTALSGTLYYLVFGVTDIAAGMAIGITGMVTAQMGAHMTYRLPRRSLRRIFGFFLIIIGLKMMDVFSWFVHNLMH